MKNHALPSIDKWLQVNKNFHSAKTLFQNHLSRHYKDKYRLVELLLTCLF